MNNTNWMKTPANHYEDTRARPPEDKLMIVFDIDGTMLDMRAAIPNLLRAYDEKHGTHTIAADFNFPQWHYYGRGPAKSLCPHEYLEIGHATENKRTAIS